MKRKKCFLLIAVLMICMIMSGCAGSSSFQSPLPEDHASKEDYAGISNDETEEASEAGAGSTEQSTQDITPENESYMEMEITGTTVEMNGFYFDDVTIEMDNQDGGLSKFFQDESEMFQILAVNYLTDGTLRLGLTVSLEDEEQMEYLFVPAQEAETEAITE